jgi:hypothetical protein
VDVLSCGAGSRFEQALWAYEGRDLSEEDLNNLARTLPRPPAGSFFARIRRFFFPVYVTTEQTMEALRLRNIRLLGRRMERLPGLDPMASRWLVTTAPQLLRKFNISTYVWEYTSDSDQQEMNQHLTRLGTLYTLQREQNWLEELLPRGGSLQRLMIACQASNAPDRWRFDQLLTESWVTLAEFDRISFWNRAFQVYQTKGEMTEGLPKEVQKAIRSWAALLPAQKSSGLDQLRLQMETDPLVAFRTFWLPLCAHWSGLKPEVFERNFSNIRTALDHHPGVRRFIFSLNRVSIDFFRELPDFFDLWSTEGAITSFYDALKLFFKKAVQRRPGERHPLFGGLLKWLRGLVQEVRADRILEQGRGGTSVLEDVYHVLSQIPERAFSRRVLEGLPLLSGIITRKAVGWLLKATIGSSTWKELATIQSDLIDIARPVLIALVLRHPPKEYLPELSRLVAVINSHGSAPTKDEIDKIVFKLFKVLGQHLDQADSAIYLNVLRHIAASLA